jgi:3-hydroxybutyryl-CoA dehydrogenase
MARVLPTLSNDAALPTLLGTLVDQDARGIANGHGFYEYTPEEIHAWEARQRRHAWLVKDWLDAEFPLASDPERRD